MYRDLGIVALDKTQEISPYFEIENFEKVI